MDRGGLVHVKKRKEKRYSLSVYLCNRNSLLNVPTSYHAKDATSVLKHVENDEIVQY